MVRSGTHGATVATSRNSRNVSSWNWNRMGSTRATTKWQTKRHPVAQSTPVNGVYFSAGLLLNPRTGPQINPADLA